MLPGLGGDLDPDTRVRECGPKEKEEGALATGILHDSVVGGQLAPEG